MTRKVRKRFILTAFGICITVLLVHIAGLIYFFFFTGSSVGHFLELLTDYGIRGNSAYATASLLLQAAFVPGAIISTYLFFRKTPSPEIFFFIFALVSFSLESLRFLAPLSDALTSSAMALVPFTRLFYFSRILSILSLFASGLFATGLTYQRQEMYLGGFVMVAFIISIGLPIDFTHFTLPFLLDAGGDTGLAIAYYAIAGLAVLNFIYAASIHNNRNYLLNALAMALFIAAKETFYYTPDTWYAIPALLALVGSTLLFTQRTHEIYLWL
jgi:hypothetical protein